MGALIWPRDEWFDFEIALPHTHTGGGGGGFFVFFLLFKNINKNLYTKKTAKKK